MISFVVLEAVSSIIHFMIVLLPCLLVRSEGQTGSPISINEGVSNEILQHLNDIRRGVMPTAADMNILVRTIFTLGTT